LRWAIDMTGLGLGFSAAFPTPAESRFVNTNNFPLDVQRHEWLRASLDDKMQLDLPSAEKVALEMGEMLGRIHWRAGYDVRDIEFIVGGDGYTRVAFYIINFNQVCHYTLAKNLANWTG